MLIHFRPQSHKAPVSRFAFKHALIHDTFSGQQAFCSVLNGNPQTVESWRPSPARFDVPFKRHAIRPNMQATNPYEPPAAESLLEDPGLPRIFVDGPLLVVASGTELPPRCIKTNQRVSDQNAIRESLLWRGRTFQLTMSSKQCSIVWYADSWVKWKTVFRKATEILMWPAFLFSIFFLNERMLWPRVALVFAVLVLAMVGVMKRPLRVVDYRKNRFWIKGCCPEFLESLQKELKSRQ